LIFVGGKLQIGQFSLSDSGLRKQHRKKKNKAIPTKTDWILFPMTDRAIRVFIGF
jgi:hypothetical protein